MVTHREFVSLACHPTRTICHSLKLLEMLTLEATVHGIVQQGAHMTICTAGPAWQGCQVIIGDRYLVMENNTSMSL